MGFFPLFQFKFCKLAQCDAQWNQCVFSKYFLHCFVVVFKILFQYRLFLLLFCLHAIQSLSSNFFFPRGRLKFSNLQSVNFYLLFCSSDTACSRLPSARAIQTNNTLMLMVTSISTKNKIPKFSLTCLWHTALLCYNYLSKFGEIPKFFSQQDDNSFPKFLPYTPLFHARVFLCVFF